MNHVVMLKTKESDFVKRENLINKIMVAKATNPLNSHYGHGQDTALAGE